MATVTIRNLSDDVVAALKERARRNSRSMEAEAREAITRLIAGETSGIESAAQRLLPPSRARSRSSGEIMARIATLPPAPAGWAEELERDDTFHDRPLTDPWESDAAAP